MQLGSQRCVENNETSSCENKIQGGKKTADIVNSTTQLKPKYVTMPILPNRPKDLNITIKVRIS